MAVGSLRSEETGTDGPEADWMTAKGLGFDFADGSASKLILLPAFKLDFPRRSVTVALCLCGRDACEHIFVATTLSTGRTDRETIHDHWRYP